MKAVKRGNTGGHVAALIAAASREPIAVLTPRGSVWPKPTELMVELLGIPWRDYETLRDRGEPSYLEVEPEMAEFLHEMKCSYVAHNTEKHQQVYRIAFPRLRPVALMSETTYNELTGESVEPALIEL